jgi:DNA-directed RNA polymerase subunit H (RpoH/RPB5)
MSNNPHVFYSVNPCIKSFRLLYDFEKDRIIQEFTTSNIHLYTIDINNWICKELNAKIDDIICIRNNTIDIYRKVTSQ